MSKEQDNGQWQGDRLIEWYAALNDEGVLSENVLGYHFSVMKVPFFVKGLIRGGLADSYAGKVPPDQAGAIFVKDIEAFASSAGIALDGQPTRENPNVLGMARAIRALIHECADVESALRHL